MVAQVSFDDVEAEAPGALGGDVEAPRQVRLLSKEGLHRSAEGNTGSLLMCCGGSLGLMALVALITVLSSLHMIGPEAQLLVKDPTGWYVQNGPWRGVIVTHYPKEERLGTVLDPEQYAVVKSRNNGQLRIEEGAQLLLLGPYDEVISVGQKIPLQENEYAIVRNNATGDIKHVQGPTLFQPKLYDQIEAVHQAFKIEKDEYIRLVNQNDGTERVMRGPVQVIPAPLEFAPDGVQKVMFLDTDSAALILNRETGEETLTETNGAVAPQAYQKVIQVRDLIHVLPHEALIFRDSKGALHVKRGIDGRNGAGLSFFLEPYADVLEMEWSGYAPPPTDNDELQQPEIEKIKVIDMRARKIFFRYQVRTRDNVKLNIDGLIFWQVKDVAKMIGTTSDPQGDVWHHARSSLISIIARRSLQDFMSQSNDMISIALEEEKVSPFYVDRGIEFQFMELTRFDCSDAATSDILQQVVVETTNKINRLTAQDSVNEVRAEALKMDIELEKLRTLYIWNKTHNDRLEAQMSGESVGVELARSTDTFIKGLKDLIPEVDKRVDLYMMHKELTARNNDTQNLVSGNAQLFITPKDLKLRVDMTSNSNDQHTAPRALTSDEDEL